MIYGNMDATARKLNLGMHFTTISLVPLNALLLVQ
jgi:hypothetical protein